MKFVSLYRGCRIIECCIIECCIKEVGLYKLYVAGPEFKKNDLTYLRWRPLNKFWVLFVATETSKLGFRWASKVEVMAITSTVCVHFFPFMFFLSIMCISA